MCCDIYSFFYKITPETLKGYRIVKYADWTYMLKWLSNPEYYILTNTLTMAM
jgi:hypothetical protein